MPNQKKPARFDSFRNKAEKLLDSPARIQKLVGQAAQKLTRRGESGFKEAKSDLQTALALVRAWISGEYRDVSRSTLIATVAALLYFVVPLDAIPDFLLGWGYIDDIAVISYVFTQIQDEIEKFRRWQSGQNTGPDDELS